MKLLRFGEPGFERPGLLDDEGILRDASTITPDWTGPNLYPDRLRKLRDLDLAGLPVVPGTPRIGAPITTPGKVVCVGLNYADHALETGFDLPAEPLIFFKSPTSVSGPFDLIRIPRTAKAVDWEVELACVIGREARNLSVQDAMAAIAGFAVANDVTERAWQFERGGQWGKAKSADTFLPLGPWLVTPDELTDIEHRKIWLTKNGKRRQESVLGHMVFYVDVIISRITEFMTLVPGDVILTGTPYGVAYNKSVPDYLIPGDLVCCGIDGLGAQHLEVRAEDQCD